MNKLVTNNNIFWSPSEDFFAAMTEKVPNLRSDFGESE